MSHKRVRVAVGVLVEASPAGGALVFIARRPAKAVLGGYWEMPGGKIEDGETAEECLAREFWEEVGLRVRVGEPLPVIEHRYDHAHVTLHPFFCQRAEGGEARNLQVTEHRWIRPHELADYQFPEANSSLIQQVMVRLADGVR